MNRKHRLFWLACLSASVIFFGSGLAGCTGDMNVPQGDATVPSASEGLEYCLLDDGTYAVERGTQRYLSEITIPDTYAGRAVTAIGDYAFASCINLRTLRLPEGLIQIGEGAFMGCESLEEIFLPQKVQEIGSHAFERCSSLKRITVDGKNTAYRSLDGALYQQKGNSLILLQYPAAGGADSLVLPAGVTKIAGDAFAGNQFLTGVTLSADLEEIGAYAFWKCSALESVVLGDGVTKIGGSAFLNCKNLSSIVIGKGLQSVDVYAFDFCKSLTRVYYCGNAEEWDAIDIHSYNTALTDAERYYYSETSLPGGWHYVDGVPCLW